MFFLLKYVSIQYDNTNDLLGIEKSWNTLREEEIFQFENDVYIFNHHFSKWGSG